MTFLKGVMNGNIWKPDLLRESTNKWMEGMMPCKLFNYGWAGADFRRAPGNWKPRKNRLLPQLFAGCLHSLFSLPCPGLKLVCFHHWTNLTSVPERMWARIYAERWRFPWVSEVQQLHGFQHLFSVLVFEVLWGRSHLATSNHCRAAASRWRGRQGNCEHVRCVLQYQYVKSK